MAQIVARAASLSGFPGSQPSAAAVATSCSSKTMHSHLRGLGSTATLIPRSLWLKPVSDPNGLPFKSLSADPHGAVNRLFTKLRLITR